jgi:hypothetical protein
MRTILTNYKEVNMKKIVDKVLESLGELLYCYFNGLQTNRVYLSVPHCDSEIRGQVWGPWEGLCNAEDYNKELNQNEK